MKNLVRMLVALFCLAAAHRPVWSDELAPRALDLDFAAAVEAWAAGVAGVRLPEPYGTLVEQLDADRYTERAAAGKKLFEICAVPPRSSDLGFGASADPSALRWLVRARAVERRPEPRYWLNRILRQLNRCETCDGAGYCPEYRPGPESPDRPAYVGVPCQRCRRFEWQHGWQWVEGARYGYLACPDCNGFGTYWTHYAVD
jgi:hypothetical protein